MKSISEIFLFKNSADMDMYLKIIKRYQEMFIFKVHAYCLMDTYAQMLIDCNGTDISKVMHGINQSYAQYYNNAHKRHGPLFESRFKNRIISEDKSIINISAYINKIPGYLERYAGTEEEYRYSSYGIYLGIRDDEFGVLDPYCILSQFGENAIHAREQYHRFVMDYDEGKESYDMKFDSQRSEYRSEKNILVRNITPDEVVDFVASYINKDKVSIKINYIKDACEIKALSAFLMRCLCDMSQKLICSEIGNISQSHASKLCRTGLKLIEEKPEYRNIINDFLRKKVPGYSCPADAITNSIMQQGPVS